MNVHLVGIKFHPTQPAGKAVLVVNGMRLPVSVRLGHREFAAIKRRVSRHMKKLYAKEAEKLKEQARSSVSGEVEIGFFKKLLKKARRTVEKVTPKFVKKLVKKAVKSKLGRWAVSKAKKLLRFAKRVAIVSKKIAQHPAFQATVMAVSTLVPGAQGIGLVYMAAMAAIKVAEGLAKGDPQAVAALAGYATQAASGDPAAAEFMSRFNTVKDIVTGTPPTAAGVLSAAGGLGIVPKEVGVALKLAGGLSRKDPNAVSALINYGKSADSGSTSASDILAAFNRVKGMAKRPPDVTKMLDTAARGSVTSSSRR